MCLLIQHITKCHLQTLSGGGIFKMAFVFQRVVSVLFSSNDVYYCSSYYCRHISTLNHSIFWNCHRLISLMPCLKCWQFYWRVFSKVEIVMKKYRSFMMTVKRVYWKKNRCSVHLLSREDCLNVRRSGVCTIMLKASWVIFLLTEILTLISMSYIF
jgi:hypothetical protein